MVLDLKFYRFGDDATLKMDQIFVLASCYEPNGPSCSLASDVKSKVYRKCIRCILGKNIVMGTTKLCLIFITSSIIHN